MPIDVVVVGAGGFGRESLDVIHAVNAASPLSLTVLGVADDDPSSSNLTRIEQLGHRHLGPIEEVLASRGPAHYVLGVGTPAVKSAVADMFDQAGWIPVTLVHPTATVGSLSRIGGGSVVCGGVQVSTNVVLGRHVHLNPSATIGHDAVIDDFASINPGAIVSGEVRVRACVLVGAGAVVLQGLELGEGSTVGASACVTRSVEAGTVVVGVPAREANGRSARCES